MPIDQSRPFQAMMHDGTYNNLDFQPGRDVVGLGGVADFGVLKEQYREKLRADGRDPAQADLAKGAIIIMTEQYMVMGLDRGIVLENRDHNKSAWEMCAKSGHASGARVGGVKKIDRGRDSRRVKVEPFRHSGYEQTNTPRLAEVVALSDKISDHIDRKRKTSI